MEMGEKGGGGVGFAFMEGGHCTSNRSNNISCKILGLRGTFSVF